MPMIITSIQHNSWGPSQCNNVRKGKKKYKTWKGTNNYYSRILWLCIYKLQKVSVHIIIINMLNNNFNTIFVRPILENYENLWDKIEEKLDKWKATTCSLTEKLKTTDANFPQILLQIQYIPNQHLSSCMCVFVCLCVYWSVKERRRIRWKDLL